MDGLLVLMGSGETSPTMVGVHRTAVARLGPDPRAVLLDTPYGFQENAGEISRRAQRYFADGVGLRVSVPAGLRGPVAGHAADGAAGEVDAGVAAVRAADWVFSGPGSPTYALDSWRGGPVGRALLDRVRQRRGVTVLASAAAVTAGLLAVPVYEIYKVGAPPRWRDGLDLLGVLGLPVAVIPHYDNAEGGTHDTRFCYLGERRLRPMERELPPEAAVLGIDEHTAVVLDLAADTVAVVGRGGMTVRRTGAGTVLAAGTALALEELRELVRRGPGGRAEPAGDGTGPARGGTGPAGGTGRSPAEPMPTSMPMPIPTLAETADGCERRFTAAVRDRDATAMTREVLDLEAAVREWAADTEEDDGVDAARSVLRSLVSRLGVAAVDGVRDPRERLAPLVGRLVDLRDNLRRRQDYSTADAVRAALWAGGVRLDDGEEGTRWSVRATNDEEPR